TVTRWLEALANRGLPKDSVAALKVACVVWRLEETVSIRDQVQAAKIVLTAKEELASLTPSKLFLPAPAIGDLPPDLSIVHVEVAADAHIVDFLREIGLTESDETSAYKKFIADGFGHFGDREWESFWAFAK